MKHRQSGFTLIEMLVAMAVFAALVAVLMLGYHQGLMLWEKSHRQSHQWLDYEFRYRLLDTLFSQAIVSDNEGARGVFFPYFQGAERSLKLMTAAPLTSLPGHVRPVVLEAVQDERRRWALYYREGARYSDPGRGIRWLDKPVVILKKLKRLSFSYLAPVYPKPSELDIRWLSKEEKHRYRTVAEWMHAYDTRQMWLYPQQMAIDFVDSHGVSYRWLFTMPKAADAWRMGIYEGE